NRVDGRDSGTDPTSDHAPARYQRARNHFRRGHLEPLDLAGAIAASRQAARNFVTRAMREVGFIAPVYVGDVVSFYTSVAREGKTSMTIEVLVEAERSGEPGDRKSVV